MTTKDFLKKKSYSPSEEKIIVEFILYFNLSISNVVNIIDPEVIVIGGGLSNFKKLYNNIDNSQNKNKNLIVKTMLGDTAGVIGAALLGSKFYKKISPLTSQNFI
jgi:fructokinase